MYRLLLSSGPETTVSASNAPPPPCATELLRPVKSWKTKLLMLTDPPMAYLNEYPASGEQVWIEPSWMLKTLQELWTPVALLVGAELVVGEINVNVEPDWISPTVLRLSPTVPEE